MKPARLRAWQRGPLAWMVHNRVTPNLLMIFLILGGIIMSGQIKKEVFPEFELDLVTVRVAYPGASPEEVEQGIVLVVEEAIRGIDGIKELEKRLAIPFMQWIPEKGSGKGPVAPVQPMDLPATR